MPLDPERWARIESLFAEAVARPHAERGAWLDDACAGDADLRREVETLLSADEHASDFIRDVLDVASDAAAAGAPQGTRIGSYRIVRELGRGGMGAVYLAERADETYRAQVAIKLVRGALASPELVGRFKSERQILASLDHPNISRLLDGGATDDDTPYIVLEYVDGLPIDEYCNQHRLTTRERLTLFLNICDAVQYAHASLVVHRDIKPSNIMVTTDGVPKLLDFGIAKLLDPERGSQSMETATGMRLLTPAYASPEQVKGQPITVASDVYSLGVLAYQLLSGRMPYQFEHLGPDEIARIVCETQPPRPSVAVSQSTSGAEPSDDVQSAADIGAARRSQPDRLRKTLAGDLDTIIMMALRKEPERRYASVHMLADDIRRYLEDRPVTAQPDTWRYRAQKFVNRNAAGVTVTAAILLLLVAFAVSMAVQTRSVARERDAATLERDKATEVAQYLVELFRVSDPGTVNPDDITARQILQDGAARIRTGLADQPLVRANLMNIIGEVYNNLGQYDSALALQQEALAILEAQLGPDHIDLANTLSDLATTERETGDYDAAEEHFRRVHAIRLADLGPNHNDVAASGNNIGWVLFAKGEYDEAMGLYTGALAIYRRDGTDSAGMARVAIGLAQTHQVLGQFEQAEQLFIEVLAIRRALHGEMHSEVAEAIHDLGALYYETGQLDQADTLLRQGLEMDKRIKGPDHPDVAAGTVLVGRVLTNLGEFDRAEPYFREALRIDRLALGDVHADVAYDVNSLAHLLHKKGDLPQAERYYREAIDMYRQTVPSDNPYLAVPLINLGSALVEMGRPEEAERLAREGLEIVRVALPEGHRLTLQAEGTVGDCLLAQGSFEGAEPLLLGRLSGFREELGEEHSMTVHARDQVVALYRAWGRTDEAERYSAGS